MLTVFMKPLKRFLQLLTASYFIASSAFGDDATNYGSSGDAKFIKGDLDGAIADYNKAIELKPDVAISTLLVVGWNKPKAIGMAR
jgi:TPR repeat